MKRRMEVASYDRAVAVDGLSNAIARLRNAEEVQAFLRDLCTPAELEALADRWQVVPHLLNGEPYREIHDATSVSVTTIGRVARCLVETDSGYQIAAKRLGLQRPRSR
ncbi:MAG: YerC/YecD family TrpR-related protein [Lysobacterales bacterium]